MADEITTFNTNGYHVVDNVVSQLEIPTIERNLAALGEGRG
jgi:hypothetical protein